MIRRSLTVIASVALVLCLSGSATPQYFGICELFSGLPWCPRS